MEDFKNFKTIFLNKIAQGLTSSTGILVLGYKQLRLVHILFLVDEFWAFHF